MNNDITKLLMKITALRVSLKYKKDRDEETELKRLNRYYEELEILLILEAVKGESQSF